MIDCLPDDIRQHEKKSNPGSDPKFFFKKFLSGGREKET